MAHQARRNSPPNIETVDELVAKSVFEKDFANLKKELETQQSITWQVVIGVAVAFVLAIGVTVVDAITSRNMNIDRVLELSKDSNDNTRRLNDLKNEIDGLRARNPYLK